MNTCVLVSQSCTTGWTDWIHGELWVCDDGLLRRSLGLMATLKHANLRTVDPNARVVERLTDEQISQMTARERNVWVPWASIRAAELRSGPATDSLHLELLDGRRMKLLWLAVDEAKPFLAEALPGVIGDRLVRTNPDFWA